MYNIAELPGTIRAQINGANLPMKTIGWEFSDIEPSDSLEKVTMWVEMVKSGKIIQAAGNPNCGRGLLLVGDPGHGKTTLASTALQELIRGMSREAWGLPDSNPKRPAMFMDYPKLLRLQKSQWSDFDDSVETMINGIYGDGPKENLIRTFVLDDLGKEHKTSSGWAEDTFDELLRARFNSGLPTIVTSNTPLSKWGTNYSEAMASFAYEAFIPIDVNSGKDLRR
jgi:DNA replication protein DnaC